MTSLSSGAAKPKEVGYDVSNALKIANQEKDKNHAASISPKYTPFFGPIKRNKFKIMASIAPEESSSNQKVILYKNTNVFNFQVFFKSQAPELPVKICDLMTFCLIMLYLIAIFNGFFAKASKAQDQIKDPVNAFPGPSECGLIQDVYPHFYMKNVPSTM